MVITNKFVLKGRLASLVETRNIFYCDIDLIAPDTYASVGHTYLNNIFSPLISYLSNLWTTSDFDIYQWVAGEWAFIGNEILANNGGSAGDILPNAVAAVLIGKVLAKRRFGRKFISGFTESNSNGNVFTGALVAALASAAVGYISSFTTVAGSTCQPGIMSKGGTFRAFNSGVVSALWGSMRRRKPGLGI